MIEDLLSGGTEMMWRFPTIARAVATALVASTLAPAPAESQEAKPGQAVSFQGRVVDLDDGRPIEGAEVVVERSALIPAGEPEPDWVGKTTLRTDAQGRFTVAFPPGQVAEPRLWLALRVNHPDYVPRKAHPSPLVSLLRGREFGDKPFFETVELEKGQIFSGEVVTPEGKPAAGVPFEFGNWGWRNNDRSRQFSNETTGRTDVQGQFRRRMPKTQTLTITVMPDAYAPFYRFWGTDRPGQNPDVWAPTELGRLVLEQGQVIKGRLLDLRGRPIAGQGIVAEGGQGRYKRAASTKADGSFAFGPLRPGNYSIFAEGQYQGGIDFSLRPMPHGVPPIRPAHVFFKKGQIPAAVELRELPSVSVEVRYVDSRGHRTRGGFATLGGAIPSEPGKRNGARFGPVTKMSSLADEEETEDQDQQLAWGRQLLADPEGRIIFRVPKGLLQANLYTIPPDETIAYKTRLQEGGPLKFWGGGQLGTIDADRKITVISYRSPTILATVRTDDGETPENVQVGADFNVRGGDYGESFIHQSDGRYRSQSLMPDHEYEVSAWATGYVPNRLYRLKLPEGAFQELSLILRSKPKPPEVGKLAPPFLVKTIDGQVLSLDGLRGKFVLLHFWMPIRGLREAPQLKGVYDRFGKDGRLAMLGLSLANDPSDAAKAIKDNGIAWPQAVLRDRGADPIVEEYGFDPRSGLFLIGPDGKLVAKGLEADRIEKAVADALGK